MVKLSYSTYDYIIVGAGSSGCVLANRLSEDPNVSVCLLEAGPEDKSPLIHMPAGLVYMMRGKKYNWQFHTEPQTQLNNRRLYTPRGKTLGGSSSINAMVYTRGVADDYNQWEASGAEGWGWKDVLPYFIKAEDNERGAIGLHGVGGPLGVADLRYLNESSRAFVRAAIQAGHQHNDDFNGENQEGVGPYQVTHRNGERCSSAKAYLTPVRDRPNLSVVTGAQVKRVLLKGSNACGVELIGSRRLKARKEVILSAGAIQSPQILMLSGIGERSELSKHNIAVNVDLPGVGKNLQDHLDIMLVQSCKKPVSFSFTPRTIMRGVKGIWDYVIKRQGMFTSTISETGGFIKTQPNIEYPDCQIHLSSALIKNHGLEFEYGYGWSLHICDLRPKSRGFVGLHSSDPQVPPLINPRYLSDPRDMEQMVEAYKAAQYISTQQPFQDLKPDWRRPENPLLCDQEIRDFIRSHAETIYHPVGTCKMGIDEMAVVDSRLRVHGVRGLRVVDASIMPTIIGGNTNAPAIMIGEKAADMILNSKNSTV